MPQVLMRWQPLWSTRFRFSDVTRTSASRTRERARVFVPQGLCKPAEVEMGRGLEGLVKDSPVPRDHCEA